MLKAEQQTQSIIYQPSPGSSRRAEASALTIFQSHPAHPHFSGARQKLSTTSTSTVLPLPPAQSLTDHIHPIPSNATRRTGARALYPQPHRQCLRRVQISQSQVRREIALQLLRASPEARRLSLLAAGSAAEERPWLRDFFEIARRFRGEGSFHETHESRDTGQWRCCCTAGDGAHSAN